LALALMPGMARAAAPAPCGAPAEMHDGWRTAAAVAEGLDPKVICAIGPTLENMKEARPGGIVVVRNGVARLRALFPRLDARALHPMESVSKSIVAMLTGIAFDRGYLKDINASVSSFFPQDADLRTPDKTA
jgi:CubicO group peptidase (beta-lactamase class C family)